MNKLKNTLPIILGVVFLISGWVKAIDPVGGALKIEEYLRAFSLTSFADYSIYISVALSTAEIMLGFFLLFGLYKIIAAFATVAMMCGFTILTAHIAFNPYVAITECGCFGEAIDITNTQTFIKNIILMLLALLYAILLFVQPNRTRHKYSLLLSLYLLIFTLVTPIYSLIFLPPFDFLEYNIGDNLTLNEEFKIYDINQSDVTDSILMTSSEKPLLIYVNHLVESDILTQNINMDDKYNCISLSPYASDTSYYINDLTAKEMVRSKRGLLLVENGVIANKWNVGRDVCIKPNKGYHKKYTYIAFLLLGIGVFAFIYSRTADE